MIWSLITTTLLAAVGSTVATATSPFGCVAFDVNWNLLAFGFNGKDYNAGTQDAWASGSPTDITTTTGRPPFNAANTTCYLSQFTNAIYVLNADSSNPANIFIYDVAGKSWSTQQVVAGTFDPSNFAAILDHDTNVFYSYSGGNLFSLDMGLLKSANATAIPWLDVQEPDLSANPQAGAAPVPGANTAGYQPVMALAQNHIHFLGVSGLPKGSAKIFVIHFSFMQPTPQSYGTAFPTTHGKTASFFMDSGVQQEFAFIPEDGSATYVVNVETNTTKTLTGPPQQDPFATYYASTNALVQLTSSGKVAFLPYDPKTTTSGGTWTTISKLPVASFGSTSSSLNSSTGSPLGSSNTGKNGTSTGSSGSSSSNNSAALRIGLTTSAGVWGSLTLGLVVSLCGVFL